MTKRTIEPFLWLLFMGWTVACSFPLTTPGSPKIILLFPAMLLATRGVAHLQSGSPETSRWPAVRNSRRVRQVVASPPCL